MAPSNSLYEPPRSFRAPLARNYFLYTCLAELLASKPKLKQCQRRPIYMSMISDASGVTDKEETNTLITSTFHIVTFVYYLLLVVHAIKCQLIHPLNKRKGCHAQCLSLPVIVYLVLVQGVRSAGLVWHLNEIVLFVCMHMHTHRAAS
jgi:hypothetical protein